jgi:hypothetical protein
MKTRHALVLVGVSFAFAFACGGENDSASSDDDAMAGDGDNASGDGDSQSGGDGDLQSGGDGDLQSGGDGDAGDGDAGDGDAGDGDAGDGDGTSTGGASGDGDGAAGAANVGGQGGEPSGPFTGMNCTQLEEEANDALWDARACESDSKPSPLTCETAVQNLCGCEIPVNNPDSEATEYYLAAKAALAKKECLIVCPKVACFKFVGGYCSKSGVCNADE